MVNNIEGNLPLFIMMVGLPGSGKSDVAKELSLKYKAEIMSSDQMRIDLFGPEYVYNYKDNKVVYNTLHKQILEKLQAGKNIIYDATNIKMFKRIKFLERLVNISCKKVCYYVAKPIMQCIKDSMTKEDGYIRTDSLMNMYYGLEVPYYYEGWDQIGIIWNGREDSTRDLFHNKDTGLYQFLYTDKKYHFPVNLGKYLTTAHDIANISHQSKEVCSASLFAEIGRPYLNYLSHLKDQDYVNPDRMSAQESIFYSCISYMGPLKFIQDTVKVQRYCLDIAMMIQWRTDLKCHKNAEILKRLLGKEMIDKIQTLDYILDESKKKLYQEYRLSDI